MKTTTVFFDLETAGVEDHHADIQLAAVAVRDWQEVGAFERKIEFDNTKADPEALKINHYNPHVWQAEALPEAVVVRAFSAFLEQYRVLERTSQRGNAYRIARLAGHNVARFDAPRLLRMFKRNGGAFLPADAFMPLDTMQLAIWEFAEAEKRPENLKLTTLAEFFGMERTGSHDALVDVRMTVEIARRLMERAP